VDPQATCSLGATGSASAYVDPGSQIMPPGSARRFLFALGSLANPPRRQNSPGLSFPAAVVSERRTASLVVSLRYRTLPSANAAYAPPV